MSDDEIESQEMSEDVSGDDNGEIREVDKANLLNYESDDSDDEIGDGEEDDSDDFGKQISK